MRNATVALLVAMLLGGCTSSTAPRAHVVTGLVRYPSGSISSDSRVTASSGQIAFTDATGRYRLVLPPGVSEVQLVAEDHFGHGVIVVAGNNTGSVEIRLNADTTEQDIVLDHFVPI